MNDYRSEHLPPENAKGNDITIRGKLAFVELNSRKYPGKVAVIDADMVPLVRLYTWHPAFDPKMNCFYVTSTDGNNRNILLHRLVTNAETGTLVDHKNHDTLDNRLSNLDVTTSRGNQNNRRDHSSFGVGVTWNKRARKFQSQIRVNGVKQGLGMYDDPDIAAAVYNFAISVIEPGLPAPNKTPLIATIEAVTSKPARKWLRELMEQDEKQVAAA